MSKYIKIRPGLKLPASFTETSKDSSEDYDVRFSADFNTTTRRYDLKEISVFRAANAAPLNGTMLRRVRVQDALEEVMRKIPIQRDNGEQYLWPYSEELERDGKTVTYKPNIRLPVGEEGQETRIVYAAEVYAIASAFGLPELREITRMLAVSQSTASRLVRQARDKGLIGDA